MTKLRQKVSFWTVPFPGRGFPFTAHTAYTTYANTVPAQKSNISIKMIGGKSLTFPSLKIIRRLLLYARLLYHFLPYNRLTDYSKQVHKLTKLSTLLSAPVLASRIHTSLQSLKTCWYIFSNMDLLGSVWHSGIYGDISENGGNKCSEPFQNLLPSECQYRVRVAVSD